MNLKEKQAVLDQIYRIFQAYLETKSLACQTKCANCCTINVTMTTVEGAMVYRSLKKNDQTDLLTRLNANTANKRFHPKFTANGIAALCQQDAEIPDEEIDPSWGKCPLLLEDMCSVYPDRPFECRSFVSTVDCRKNQIAEMPDEIVTVNNLFKQFIEHTDADGKSGNLTDVLRHIETGDSDNLIANRPIPVLIADPKHQSVIEPLVTKIQNIRI